MSNRLKQISVPQLPFKNEEELNPKQFVISFVEISHEDCDSQKRAPMLNVQVEASQNKAP